VAASSFVEYLEAVGVGVFLVVAGKHVVQVVGEHTSAGRRRRASRSTTPGIDAVSPSSVAALAEKGASI
jgi:hypothetical protein